MSHFSRLKTKIKNKEILLQCLTEMGYQVTEGGTIKGYAGQQTVDLSIQVGRGYGIGFVMNNDGYYEMVADWWGVKGAAPNELLTALQGRINRIQQAYAMKTVLSQTESQGFNLVEKIEERDGSIRLVVRRWR
jgi:hypothetical protein